MSQVIWSAVISAVIAGVFGLIGKYLEIRLSEKLASSARGTIIQTANATPYPSYQHGNPVGKTIGTSPSTLPFSFGRVLIHIGVLQLVLNFVGFILGFTFAATGQYNDLVPLILLVGTIGLIVGFAWAGARVNKAVRWKHLLYVAIGVAIVTLVTNSLILQAPITGLALIFAFFQTFVAMGIGGAIASAFK